MNAVTSKTSLFFRLLFGTVAIAAVGGCDIGGTTADRLGHAAHMYEHQAPEGRFVMTTYERAYAPGGDADIYLEGDSRSWMQRAPARGDTPVNPVALHLATRDDTENVIYLALPCQYGGLADGHACSTQSWTFEEFSPAAVATEDATLDDLKARYGFRHFNLIGYSGGGAMAVLLAARRHDVASIRTVAGDLAPATLAQLRGDPAPSRDALDPVAVAPQVAHIPQHHFLGSWDGAIPAAVYDHYRFAAGPSTCIRAGTIAGADHDAGWVDEWPRLLKAPVDCHAVETSR